MRRRQERYRLLGIEFGGTIYDVEVGYKVVHSGRFELSLVSPMSAPNPFTAKLFQFVCALTMKL
jgi:hypothetical protein